jgi:sec-independent protein translocase protein TatB
VLGLGSGELLIVFLVALIVLGPNKLPDAARQMGKLMAELRRLSGGFQAEMQAALREPTPTLPPLPTPPAEQTAPAIVDVAPPAVAQSSDPAEAPTPARRRKTPLRADGAVPAEDQLAD